MLNEITHDFLILFATIDPIGSLALFVALTANVSPRERKKIALRAIVYAAVVLLLFLVVGEIVLGIMGVRLASFQLAGGIILFLFGLQMVFGTGVASTSQLKPEPDHDLAAFPLAIPSIASPGAIMAVVILTDNNRYSIAEQAVSAGVLLVVLLITLAVLLMARPILRVIGNAGANLLIRIMGMILCALAAEQVLAGAEQIRTSGVA